MSTPPRVAARLSESQIAKRDAIIGAAMEVLVVSGVHGCTVRAIAQGAGVSKGTVHYYFEDVDRIVDAAMLRATQVWIDWLSRTGDPVATFWHSIDACLEPFAAGDRALMPLWLEYWAVRTRSGALLPIREVQSLLVGFVGELLRATGTGDVDVKAMGVTGYLVGMAMQETVEPVAPQVVRRQIAAICEIEVPAAEG